MGKSKSGVKGKCNKICITLERFMLGLKVDSYLLHIAAISEDIELPESSLTLSFTNATKDLEEKLERIIHSRNLIREIALKENYDYFLSLEQDVIPPKDGQLLGLTGYELEITGGSDTAGFPMRPDIEGYGRKKLVLDAGATGFKGKKRKKAHKQNHYFMTKRKTIRGNTISQFTQQINLKVVKHGDKSIAELWGITEKQPEAETIKTEAKKE